MTFNPPPGQTTDCVLVSWVHTSSVHAYPSTLFEGTWEQCEARRVRGKPDPSLRTYQREAMPSAY